MNIACDLDGVLISFNDGFAKVLRNINPQVVCDTFDPSFPPIWAWPQSYGYSAADESAAWNEAKFSGLFWRSLFPYASAWKDLEYLDSLRSSNDIYFVTSRPGPTAKVETEDWLAGHGYPKPTVIISNSQRKKDFCYAAEIDVLVEDKPETLLDLPLTVKSVLIQRPYNAGYWGYFNVTASTVREGLSNVM